MVTPEIENGFSEISREFYQNYMREFATALKACWFSTQLTNLTSGKMRGANP